MTAQDILKRIDDEKIEYVGLKFTDSKGQLQHLSVHVTEVNESFFADGTMFDGSSISGWKAIHDSDMIMMPDVESAHIDPFCSRPTLGVFCDIIDPGTGEGYERDPRFTAKKAEAYLKSTGIGDKVFFGPELEFFVFDDVKYSTRPESTGFSIDSKEMPINNDTHYESGNLGHRPQPKGGYFPASPIDTGEDIRSEMLSVIDQMGVPIEKHHHEVAPAQHELSIQFSTLTHMADRVQTYKYVVHNVAKAYGKTATFMPKPMYGDNGTGMHVHQSIWKGDKPMFAGDQYAGLSETCLYYIGGIMKHAKALNLFANPSTNSYKRLVPGFEAPTLLAYSARNRSAACRIPHTASPNAKRMEMRFPDPMANPYLLFSAMMMAGIDGVQNKIHPGDPIDEDLYALPPNRLKKIKTLCTSLRQAIDETIKDHDYLLKDDVFTEDQINAYIELKEEENARYERTPHPVEFDLYYST